MVNKAKNGQLKWLTDKYLFVPQLLPIRSTAVDYSSHNCGTNNVCLFMDQLLAILEFSLSFRRTNLVWFSL